MKVVNAVIIMMSALVGMKIVNAVVTMVTVLVSMKIANAVVIMVTAVVFIRLLMLLLPWWRSWFLCCGYHGDGPCCYEDCNAVVAMVTALVAMTIWANLMFSYNLYRHSLKFDMQGQIHYPQVTRIVYSYTVKMLQQSKFFFKPKPNSTRSILF